MSAHFLPVSIFLASSSQKDKILSAKFNFRSKLMKDKANPFYSPLFSFSNSQQTTHANGNGFTIYVTSVQYVSVRQQQRLIEKTPLVVNDQMSECNEIIALHEQGRANSISKLPRTYPQVHTKLGCASLHNTGRFQSQQ